MGPHFCARSSFNQHRNERGCVGTDAPQRRYVTNSKEAMKKRADASFKNTRMQSRLEKAARENHNLSVDYEVQAKIMREKTARLKALRLAKEAAEKKNSGA